MTGKMPETVRQTDHAADPSSSDAALHVEHLYVGNFVKDVSMSVGKGEIVGLGGLEGQGQSQFLRALFGVVPYQSGTVTVDGVRKRYKNPAAAVKDGIGFISGDRNRESVFGQRSIGENIYSARLAQKSDLKLLSRSRINRSTQKIVEEYAIKIGDLDNPISSLSGGNQQKAVFGRWSFVAPRVLLLDDPTKGVDVTTRREMHRFLRRTADGGTTVVIVSSDNDELLEVADRILVFFEGSIHSVLAGESKTEERLVSSMLGLQ